MQYEIISGDYSVTLYLHNLLSDVAAIYCMFAYVGLVTSTFLLEAAFALVTTIRVLTTLIKNTYKMLHKSASNSESD